MDFLKMEDEKLVSQITEDFKKAEAKVERYKEEWKENYRRYKSKLEKKKEGRANLFIPYTWATVEQLKARALQTLFSKPPYVSYAGVGKDDVDGAMLMEKLVQYQMKEKIKLPYKFIFALNNIFNYGTSIFLYQWKLEEKEVFKTKDIIDTSTGAKIDEEIIKEKIAKYDDPDIEVIPLDNFFPDPEGYDIESCAYCCTTAEKSLKYLKEQEKAGKYKLPDNIEEEGTNQAPDFRNNVNDISSTQNDRKNKYELISYYTNDVHIVMLNRKYIILKEENPLYCREKPFKRAVAFPLEKEFYGMSIVEVLSNLQDELNTTRNQRIDNVSLMLNTSFLKRRNADIDPEMKIYPGAVIEVDDIHNDLKPLEFADVTGSATNEEMIIKQDMQYVSSVSEYARGATPQRKETATTVTSIQDASNTVFNYIIMVIETTGLLPLADAVKELDQQYIKEDKMIRLFDMGAGKWNYENIPPNAIQGSYDVVSASPRLEAQATKEARRKDILDMFNMLTTNELTKPYVIVPEFIKKLMETSDIKDYQKLISEIPMIGGVTNGEAFTGNNPGLPGTPGMEVPQTMPMR